MYNFNEKQIEEVYDKEAKAVVKLQVWQSPKYLESKAKAVEILDQKKYGVSASDFWILMNKTKSGKMAYTGLIISHNGCLKINDTLDEKLRFKPECLKRIDGAYGNSLIYEYNCPEQGLYEVGEVNAKNCTNDYPFAMAFKRCFDRVVLKNSKLAYSGIYSDSEAEEFKERFEEPTVKSNLDEKLVERIKELGGTLADVAKFGRCSVFDLTDENLKQVIEIKEKQLAEDKADTVI